MRSSSDYHLPTHKVTETVSKPTSCDQTPIAYGNNRDIEDWKASTQNSVDTATFLYHLDSNHLPAGVVNVEWKAVKKTDQNAHLRDCKVQPPGYQARVSSEFSQNRFKRLPRFSVHVSDHAADRQKQDIALNIIKSRVRAE